MTRVAAIDCGTNSIRLLILAQDGPTTELAREVRLARLGQDVDATGEFHLDALERAFAVFDDFQDIISRHEVDRVRVVATSAARDVRNRTVFEQGVRQRLGVEVDIISGDEEAHLTAAGVLSGVQAERPALVIDIGGGSTELVVIDQEISSAVSLNIGAVRVHERFLHTDPPTSQEIAQARAFVARQLAASAVDFDSLASAIGVAGTVTSVAARKLGLVEYSRCAVHRTLLSRTDIAQATGHWLGAKVADIVAEPCMHPLRAQVIGAGALILDEISALIPSGKVLVSESDILDAVALQMVENR